jgi:endo-alpha-1,4-polygalactosaminidase (GH114 family)
MAWEKRGNNLYLYQKVWINGTAKSIYLGRTDAAVYLDRLDQHEREKKYFKKVEKKRQRENERKLDAALDEISEINKSLVDALFLLNGFHQHKRQWRKKRK